MYDFYPEWGPARHRETDGSAEPPQRRPRYWTNTASGRTPAAAGARRREHEADRPDDN